MMRGPTTCSAPPPRANLAERAHRASRARRATGPAVGDARRGALRARVPAEDDAVVRSRRRPGHGRGPRGRPGDGARERRVRPRGRGWRIEPELPEPGDMPRPARLPDRSAASAPGRARTRTEDLPRAQEARHTGVAMPSRSLARPAACALRSRCFASCASAPRRSPPPVPPVAEIPVAPPPARAEASRPRRSSRRRRPRPPRRRTTTTARPSRPSSSSRRRRRGRVGG